MDRGEREHFSEFANFIRRRRRELGLTQEQLAQRCGDPFIGSYVAKLELDAVAAPPPERLRQLARALDVPVASLRALIYPDDDETPPTPPRPPAPWPDPALVARIKKGLRDLGVTLPDDQLTQGAVALAAMEGHWKSRAEIEATEGPIGEPPTLDPPSRDARGAG